MGEELLDAFDRNREADAGGVLADGLVPELPGLIAASVCRMSLNGYDSSS